MTESFPLASREDSAPVIVGIGASAGGLEALRGFLDALPDDQNLAIVIVQHLDPDHDSLLKELLEKRTRIPIRMAEDGLSIEAGQIYLIAPGQSLTVANDQLRSRDFEVPRGRRRPIDEFFVSLARNSRERAVGIVLSGTGSDGTHGTQVIKEHGGLVFAQALSEAKYDGMPRSVVESGCADFVLPTGDMFSVLNDYFDCMGGIPSEELSDRTFIDRAMRHVQYRTGHDFSGYKPGTLLRRIAVRMAVLGVTKPAEYLKVLISDHDEADRLFRDMLISVTRFFRDRAVFDELRDRILPELLDGKTGNDELRIWVPGCSSGQEAYSIAMLVSEAMERSNAKPNVMIFATDISEAALGVARRGRYLNTIVEDVPAEFLHKYFDWQSDSYAVNERLRSMVQFSVQSLTRDPPFSQLDMISCRNVMIYFDKAFQERAMKVFHYALRESGILVLGTSEMTVNADGLFDDVSRQNRIYRRCPGEARRLELPTAAATAADSDPVVVQASVPDARHMASHPFTDELLDVISPAYLVVSETGELVYASDAATKYLVVAAGRPQLDVDKLIRKELEKPLRRILNRETEGSENTTLEFDAKLWGETSHVKLTRRRLYDGQNIVLIDEAPLSEAVPNAGAEGRIDANTAAYIQELEADLDDAREKVRAAVEELETSNEELKSSNEEMMSMNEELQSANEELTTTNDELNLKITEVREANSDLANFIRATKVSTIFLDANLKLRSFTPEAQKLFRFQVSDLGRPIDDIGSDLDMRKLVEDCRATIDQDELMETDYDTPDDSYFSARLVPYGRDDDTSGGVVVSFFDVTELRNLARDAESARTIAARHQQEVEELYDSSPQAMAVLDEDLRYVRANKKLADLAGTTVDQVIGRKLGDLSSGITAQMRELAQSVIATGDRIEGQQLRGRNTAEGNPERVWETDWFAIRHDGKFIGVGLNVRDITEQVILQFELRRVMQELQHRVKNMLANVLALVSRAGRDVTVDRPIFDVLGQRIQALAQTHKLLTQSNWASAKLHEVLKPELTHVYGDERVKLKGPNIVVNARAALSLSMAIHELATNAAKYGAFSIDEGTVSLSWVRQDDGDSDNFIFTWREEGGPPATRGEQSGFGSQLIKSTIEGSLGGQVEFSWEQIGLSCVFTVPAGALIEIPNESIFDTVAS
ncbi:chemotaxis protein CheB [Salipiger sp. IMCC34102]|uniref:chemotaxis protein CheB n=1 Tax=Salipiger sp. IMCC34102 TaxID=2510647 RepID=UPI0013EE15AB|nr:chemotaxis protein CheB [Salipiger sp. IMCC34102]